MQDEYRYQPKDLFIYNLATQRLLLFMNYNCDVTH